MCSPAGSRMLRLGPQVTMVPGDMVLYEGAAPAAPSRQVAPPDAM